MAAYPSTSGNQTAIIPIECLLDERLPSYHSTAGGPPDGLIYADQPSGAAFQQLLCGASLPAHGFGHLATVSSRGAALFIPPTNDTLNTQPISGPCFSDHESLIMMNPQSFPGKHLNGQNFDSLQFQGLSLTLGTEVPISGEVDSYNTEYGISCNVGHSEQNSQTTDDLNFSLARGAQMNTGTAGDLQGFASSRKINDYSFLYKSSIHPMTVNNSKYLQAAQDLLDEVVSVHNLLNSRDRCRNFHSLGQGGRKDTDLKSDLQSGSCPSIPEPSDTNKLTAVSSEITLPAERHELQRMMTNLTCTLDQVDRRYKRYNQQMQQVISSFEIVAGTGAAKSYTSLALQTISRQFRCLRDAIKRQIEVLRQSLGEQDSSQNSPGGGLSRLRYVEQQIRQQKSLQQFGMMRQTWRPQRGLPESAVSVLRAWLFEHFLHPYPKDSEKLVLARQTGLTRSQVANWFINARVRLWKPMIEEMYKEEFGAAARECQSPKENMPAETRESEDERGEQLHESFTSEAAVSLRSVVTPDAGSSEDEKNYKDSVKLQIERDENLDDHGSCLGQTTLTNHVRGDKIVTASDACGDGISMIKGGTLGNQVSLALGLQQNPMDSQLFSGAIQLRGGETSTPTFGIAAGAEYYFMEPANHEDKFANPQILSDFVA